MAGRTLTKDVILEICEDIKKGVNAHTAAMCRRLDMYQFNHALVTGLVENSGATGMEKWVAREIAVAEAEAERALVLRWLDASDKKVIDACRSFLTTTNPKFQQRFKMSVELEVEMLLEVVKTHVTPKVFIKILEDISQKEARCMTEHADHHPRGKTDASGNYIGEPEDVECYFEK